MYCQSDKAQKAFRTQHQTVDSKARGAHSRFMRSTRSSSALWRCARRTASGSAISSSLRMHRAGLRVQRLGLGFRVVKCYVSCVTAPTTMLVLTVRVQDWC